MVFMIIILGIFYNGIFVVDKLGLIKFIKDIINRIGKIGGIKVFDLELGFF